GRGREHHVGAGGGRGQREPVGRGDRSRRHARDPRRRVLALRHLHEGSGHRRARLGRAHERLHGAARAARRLRRRGRRARRLDLRGAPVRARRRRRPRRRLHREGAAAAPPRRAGGPARGGRFRRRRPVRVPPLRLGAAALQLPRRPRGVVLMSTPAVEHNPWHLRESYLFPRHVIAEIQRAAAEGIYDIRGFGAKRRLPHFDDLLFLGASVSRYPLEGYRERCDTDVTLGTRFATKPLELKIPVTIAGMSFGALSAPAKEALGRAATDAGTSTTTGDGGMTP